MIVHVVEWLARHGVDRAVLSLGYRADAFIEAFPSQQIAGVTLEYVVEPEPLDTAGAIRFAARSAGVSETFLVLNGDVLTDFDASALVEFHRLHGAQGTIALTPVEDPSRFGVVSTDEQGRVSAFIEKPPAGTAPTNLINAGIYVLEPPVLDRIPDGRRVSIERETFPALVGEGALYALASDAYWLDTGTPAQFIQVQLDILKGRCGFELTLPEVRLGIFADPSARVAGRLDPHSLVGPNVSIAEGAAVSDSVIGAGSKIGPGAVVERSVLMAGCELGQGAVVSDSIIGSGAVIGERARVGGTTIVALGAELKPCSVLDGARYPLG
jgi:mannose-1-phosphate guanylyltransferase